MAQLARLTVTHSMVMNWLVLNPEKSLRECADHFGYTQSWLSTVIHSDIFQHALREKQLAIGLRVADSIPQRLRKVADIALDKLATKVEETEDPEFLLDATDKILHRMGYAPASARNPAGSPAQFGNGIQNNFFVNAGDLANARELMQRASVIEGEAEVLGPQADEPRLQSTVEEPLPVPLRTEGEEPA